MTQTNGFELLLEQEIPELNTRAQLFRHVRTGARLLSLENDDENKVFSINFRTPPPDSTGVAHILEHSVLCGSRKYPVKEPFVELLKGSLQTFLNAMTYPDRTVYPVASQNLQDFYNLIDVYLDAVLYPNLTRHTYEQEAWHYEAEEPGGPLGYRGVVFNEMKGSYSSPDDYLEQQILTALFPDTLYGLDSGGHPLHIPDLTYEQLLGFHRQYYHPANALIYFYGDDPPAERLALMDAWLREFEPLHVEAPIPLHAPFAHPQVQEEPYAAGDEAEGEARTYVTVSWVLGETTDPRLMMACNMLSEILIGRPASPLRKALIESGLGEDLAGLGLESDLRQVIFSTGLKGVEAGNAEAVERLILDTLRDLAADGIDGRTVEAAVNTVEFRLRENNTGRFPRGLALMLRLLKTWTYDADPLALLAFEASLAAIKADLAAGKPVFEELIRTHLLQNPHRSTLILKPDAGLQARWQEVEQQRLAAAQAAMSPTALQAVVENTATLRRLQETPDPPAALATLPRLSLADLDRENKLIPLAVSASEGASILHHDLFTNGILYLDLGFDLHNLPVHLLPYANLIGRALLEMGTAQEDYVSLSQRIGSKTGGINHALFTATRRDGEGAAAWFLLRGKATVQQSRELLDILSDVLLGARLDDRQRFRQIVLEEKARQEAQLAPMGHLVVHTRLSAHFGPAEWAAEQMGGLSYLFFLRRLAQEIDEDWEAVQARLETVRGLLINRQTMLANVTLDEANYTKVAPQLDGLLASLPVRQVQAGPWSPQPLPRHEGFTFPAQVNYVGKGANLYELDYALHGSVHAIAGYLRTTWLWERVRVQGGAYGGLCLFDQRSGVFNYLSYRDPNLAGTLENYDAAAEFVRTLDLSQEELTKAIIGAIGQMDAYLLPDARGFVSMQRYLVGETDALRQQVREELLASTPGHFRAFGDVLARVAEAGDVVVLGSEAAIQAHGAGNGLNVTRVL